MFKKITNFLREELWLADLRHKSRRKGFLIRTLRILVLAFKGFFEDRAALRASSLTYFTMLSIVPIFALGFGMAKGFGFEQRLHTFLNNNFQSQEEILKWITGLVDNLLQNTKGGLVAGIGSVVLFWSVIQVLNNIELSFNDIWQVKKSRSLVRKFTDYLAIMIISPFAIAISGSVMVRIQGFADSLDLLQPIVVLLIKIIPYASIWILFTIIYIVMPNTKVKFMNALVAGIFAGTLTILVQWAYIHFQIGVTRFNTLYGSFAAIPLFLVWLQVTWLIVLLGAELSFAYQNVENYEFEKAALNLSTSNKRLMTLLILHQIIRNFHEGGHPMSSHKISQKLGIPNRLVSELIFSLVKAGLLVELAYDDPRQRAYNPAIDTNRISVGEVIKRLDNTGGSQLFVLDSDDLERIVRINEGIMESIGTSPSNLLIKDI